MIKQLVKAVLGFDERERTRMFANVGDEPIPLFRWKDFDITAPQIETDRIPASRVADDVKIPVLSELQVGPDLPSHRKSARITWQDQVQSPE